MRMQLPQDVTVFELYSDPVQIRNWEQLLSSEEREQMERFRSEKRRLDFVMGRAGARIHLSRRLGIDAPNISIVVSPDGSLTCGSAPVYLSIAHSNGITVSAVALRPVGIDVEYITPRHPELSRFLLHADESGLIDTLPIPVDRALILIWTLKEAMLKALRTGFRISPKKIRTEINFASRTAVLRDSKNQTFHASFEERNNFYLAVAYDSRGQ